MTSRAALTTARADGGSSRPSAILASAAARFTMPSARMIGGGCFSHADLEIAERALRLGAPIFVGGYLDRAERSRSPHARCSWRTIPQCVQRRARGGMRPPFSMRAAAAEFPGEREWRNRRLAVRRRPAAFMPSRPKGLRAGRNSHARERRFRATGWNYSTIRNKRLKNKNNNGARSTLTIDHGVKLGTAKMAPVF